MADRCPWIDRLRRVRICDEGHSEEFHDRCQVPQSGGYRLRGRER
ncbi:hypothetical protein FRUB_02510 [Fimbriiglobus ruber]|uniref:Uncharacterized protein n=1 Tax=Fimbriiglobus ruber TaxID=1908690 RepID=A0A225DGM1_9BACT|nr:hypothetical protein FRUB_08892 [Fimbriiglobus ruber]OWK42913.1 hypothetical protein FRUB_02510 [Fimbriiglobus ruber]